MLRRSFLASATLAPMALAQTQSALTRHDRQARALLATLSLDQKIGQMIQPEPENLKSLDEIETLHLGSLLSGGNSDPKAGNTLQAWTDLYESLQRRALAAQPRIPLLYGIDSVHGMSNVVGAVIFPHNIGLGCTRNAKLVEEISRITALETRATGVNWGFAPCVTAPQDIRWGRTYEGFSEDPAIIAPLGAAATRGLQWNDLKHPNAIAACVKHFAGDGGTTFGTGLPKGNSGERFPLDRGDTRGDEQALYRMHIAQYIPSIQAGAATIMPSYNSWNGVKCSGSKRLLTDILKKQLGFQGFLISDYNAIEEIPGTFKEQIAISTNAGMDMFMVPARFGELIALLRENINEGKIPMARIDDAVLRILRVKYAMGLMDPKSNVMRNETGFQRFGSMEHREKARQAVRESLVVLKNDPKLLPLQNVPRVYVAGRSADDIGNQCGGWTISWQGKSGNTTMGTTIAAAFKMMNVELASNPKDAKVGIACIGETPYAEMEGDRADLRLSKEDIQVVRDMKNAGLRVVAVIISGRPLIIDEILPDADAIVAAWWPGTEGLGITDILLGRNRPTGKLSFTWPAAATTTYRRGDPAYKALYPLGHGLTW